MKIYPTREDFPEQLKAIYKNIDIPEKRTSQEIIDFVNQEYGLIPVTSYDGLDYYEKAVAKGCLEIFTVVLDDDPDVKVKEYSFKTYELKNCGKAKIFYDHKTDYELGRIYICHEQNTDKLYCNSNLLEFKLILLAGLDKYDVENQTQKYILYLNDCYGYDWLLDPTICGE